MRDFSPTRQPTPIILGVFGSRAKVTEDAIHNTLHLILQELGQLPDKVLIPAEGISSVFLYEWAESLKIPCQMFQSDWIRNGRIAQILRDDRIQKECTHALVFLGQKSNKLEKYAEKLAKQKKVVFTSSYHTQELEQIVFEETVSTPVRKSDKGKGQTLLKFQKTE
jgi:hypothetical protein